MAEKSVGVRILEVIADREGVDVRTLEPRLYDVVDAESLETLFRDGHGFVTFRYLDYVVTVDHEQNVTVESAGSNGEM